MEFPLPRRFVTNDDSFLPPPDTLAPRTGRQQPIRNTTTFVFVLLLLLMCDHFGAVEELTGSIGRVTALAFSSGSSVHSRNFPSRTVAWRKARQPPQHDPRHHHQPPRKSLLVLSSTTERNTERNHRRANHPAVNAAPATNNQTVVVAEHHRGTRLPRHVGLICDGNGRWATARNLPRAAGHLEGARRLVTLVQAIVRERQQQQQPNEPQPHQQQSVSCLTLYAFSTENWNRSEEEIAKIFEAIEFAARALITVGDLKSVSVRILGDLEDARIPESLRACLTGLEQRTQKGEDNDHRLSIALAVNYGGRKDLVKACQSLAQQVRDGTLEASAVTEEALEAELATADLPPLDLVVRTGGEHRLSNFLLWECAYAELLVTDVLWPDFCDDEWRAALRWYAQRKRNFGGRANDKDETDDEGNA